MRLSELLGKGDGLVTDMAQAAEIEITGITADSRKVAAGNLFAALPGTVEDGRRYIDDALWRGAVAILAPEDADLAALSSSVALVTDSNPRRRYATLAARYFERQPETVAAVTGTNGKTSVAVFLRQIWAALGMPAGSTGTLGTQIANPGGGNDVHIGGSLTTPDPADLHATLAELKGRGVDHLAMEASSHGLDQYRLDGVRIRAAGFTNLSRDHLDYHGDEERYFAAKKRLFGDLLQDDGVAVLNADDVRSSVLRAVAQERGCRVIDTGRDASDIVLREQTPNPAGQSLDIEIFGRHHRIELPLIGGFQASNALLALGLAIGCGADADAAPNVLGRLASVRGRLEQVAVLSSGASIYVDYAHTPDALVTVLQAIRPHVTGKLSVIFGCGGDRDPGKRPLMGAAAAQHADRVILTDDNPRSEDPATIRSQAMTGCPGALDIGDRRAAIAVGIETLAAGDVLIVAGKGHEQGQTVGGRVLPFDDASVVRDIVGGERA